MSGLKIQQVPAAFVDVGAKHNALVDVVKTMRGENGITVVASDANVIIRGSSTGSSGDAVNVVGVDGKLNAVVKHSTWAAPTTYPTELGVIIGSGESFLSEDGFTYVDNADGIFAALNYYGLRFIEPSGSLTLDQNGLVWEDAFNKAYIDLDGFTFRNASATGTLGPGYIELWVDYGDSRRDRTPHRGQRDQSDRH